MCEKKKIPQNSNNSVKKHDKTKVDKKVLLLKARKWFVEYV